MLLEVVNLKQGKAILAYFNAGAEVGQS